MGGNLVNMGILIVKLNSVSYQLSTVRTLIAAGGVVTAVLAHLITTGKFLSFYRHLAIHDSNWFLPTGR
jgi:hypothetical protein